MRAALIIMVLALTVGSDVVASDNPFTEELARREGFSCSKDFVTMKHTTGGTFDQNLKITIRKTAVLEVWTWEDGRSSVWLKGLGAGAESSRILNISAATSAMARKCLEAD